MKDRNSNNIRKGNIVKCSIYTKTGYRDSVYNYRITKLHYSTAKVTIISISNITRSVTIPACRVRKCEPEELI